MSTLTEAKQALAQSEQDLVTTTRLFRKARPLLHDLLQRLADDAGALRDVSDAEALAVRAAIIFTLNADQVSRLRHCVANAIAETN